MYSRTGFFVGAAQIMQSWYEMVKVQMSVMWTIATVALAFFILVMCFDVVSVRRNDVLDCTIICVFVAAIIILRIIIGFNILWYLSIVGSFMVALLIYVLIGKILR